MELHQFLVIKTNQNIPALAEKLWCGNRDEQLRAISQFIEILSTNNRYVIAEVIKNPRVVPQFVEFLSSEEIVLQSMAAGALNLIATGRVMHKNTVIACGAVKPLMRLLGSSSDEVIEQALGALNNIAVGSDATRNQVIRCGVLLPLLSLLRNTSKSKLSIFKRATLTLLNLCRAKYPAAVVQFFEEIRPSLPALRFLLFNMPDEVLANVCWFLSCLTRHSHKYIIDAIVEANFCKILVVLLCTGSKAVEPALLTLGDISAVTSPQKQNIPELAKELCSDNLDTQLKAMCQFNDLLTTDNVRQVHAVLNTEGVVPQFVKFLSSENIDLQCMAAGAFTWVAVGPVEEKIAVVQHGAVEPLVKLLSSSCDEVKEQALYALNNIATDSPSTRNHVLDCGVLLPLITLLQNTHKSKLSILKIATLTLLNLCRGNPPPPFDTLFEQIRPALPVLRSFLFHMPEEIVLNVCWTISCLTHRRPKNIIQEIVDANFCKILVGLLVCTVSRVIEPALLILGDISAVTDPQILVDAGISPCLEFLLTQSIKNILIQACWTVSNITAGKRGPIQDVIDNNIIVQLVRLMRTAEFEIKREAAWAISNATNFGSLAQIRYLVGKGCITELCNLLTCTNSKTVKKCLEGVENILESGEFQKRRGINNFAVRVKKCGGLQKIEMLQRHENIEIRNNAVEIFNRYYWP